MSEEEHEYTEQELDDWEVESGSQCGCCCRRLYCEDCDEDIKHERWKLENKKGKKDG